MTYESTYREFKVFRVDINTEDAPEDEFFIEFWNSENISEKFINSNLSNMLDKYINKNIVAFHNTSIIESAKISAFNHNTTPDWAVLSLGVNDGGKIIGIPILLSVNTITNMVLDRLPDKIKRYVSVVIQDVPINDEYVEYISTYIKEIQNSNINKEDEYKEYLEKQKYYVDSLYHCRRRLTEVIKDDETLHDVGEYVKETEGEAEYIKFKADLAITPRDLTREYIVANKGRKGSSCYWMLLYRDYRYNQLQEKLKVDKIVPPARHNIHFRIREQGEKFVHYLAKVHNWKLGLIHVKLHLKSSTNISQTLLQDGVKYIRYDDFISGPACVKN